VWVSTSQVLKGKKKKKPLAPVHQGAKRALGRVMQRRKEKSLGLVVNGPNVKNKSNGQDGIKKTNPDDKIERRRQRRKRTGKKRKGECQQKASWRELLGREEEDRIVAERDDLALQKEENPERSLNRGGAELRRERS